MSDPSLPGELPPDLPPEYADAYRRAYERALRGGVEPDAGEDPEPASGLEPEPVSGPAPGLEPQLGSASAGGPAAPEATQPLEDFEHLFVPKPGRGPGAGVAAAGGLAPGGDERPAWLVPALLAGLVVLLIAGAYGLGLLFSSSVDNADVATEEPDGVVLGEDGSKPAEGSPSSDGGGGRYQGATEAVAVGAATGSCEAPPSVDAAGNRIRYAPVNSYDGDLSTAWRCNGDGVGQTLTLTLAEQAEIGEVGLVPGYAKTDPRSGADRYAENNRITRVRWTFSDGSSVVQELDGAATNRSLQSIRIPPVDSDTVSVEVLASTRGPRNTIAVSEVRLGGTTG